MSEVNQNSAIEIAKRVLAGESSFHLADAELLAQAVLSLSEENKKLLETQDTSFCVWCKFETKKVPEIMADHMLSCKQSPLVQWDKQKDEELTQLREAVKEATKLMTVWKNDSYAMEQWLERYRKEIG